MALRIIGIAGIAAAATFAVGCGKDKEAPKDPTTGSGSGSSAKPPLEAQCERLAKVCGDQAKHVEKMLGACILAAAGQREKGCDDAVLAAYGCFEKELCALGDKVWALEDLKVLAARHKKCVAEQEAVTACVGK